MSTLFVEPGHFYSPIPSVEEIKQNENRVFGPLPTSIPGVDLNEAGQLATLRELTSYYHELPFRPERTPGLRYHFENPFYSYSDGIFLYSMMRRIGPQRIIEVGSGYSSCVMLDTNELFFDGAIRCTFIDPHPQTLLSLVKPGDIERTRLIARKVQELDVEEFMSLSDRDILFIDSTHVTKTFSDVNFLLFEVLPRLRSGVYIHFHDVFYPFEYPRAWIEEGRAWNEDYILRAFLQYNDKFKIVLFASYLASFHGQEVTRRMPLCARYWGGSIWLRKEP